MKQVIVLRSDLPMSRGKLAAQACHASVSATLSAPAEDINAWLQDGQTKIVLSAPSLADLEALQVLAEKLQVVHVVIRDAGRTELAAGTPTALAVGPAADELVDRVTGAQPLFK